MIIEIEDEEELKKIAEEFSKRLVAGDVVFLEGEMGAGKTTFVYYLANALNSKTPSSSPTFTIIQEYDADLPLIHMDFYRLTNTDEADMLDLNSILENKNTVKLIEWPRNIDWPGLNADKTVSIEVLGGHSRRLMFK